MNFEDQIEQEIKDKRLIAPRITPEDIEAKVVRQEYHVFAGTTTMVCCLVLQNGYTVVGKSACVSPANFDLELGQKIARQDAMNQIWALEGYLLREKLYQQGLGS